MVGGPRFDTVIEAELGVDRIFGRGTTPGEVASYLVHALHAGRHGPGPATGRSRCVTRGEGLAVTHRRYVPYGHAHYGGSLVDGAYVLGMFGDVATEVCIRTDGDEGLFASYSDVQFRAPVLAGDVLEATATVTRVGRRSRDSPSRRGWSAGPARARASRPREVLAEPVVVVTATGTIVVPAGD